MLILWCKWEFYRYSYYKYWFLTFNFSTFYMLRSMHLLFIIDIQPISIYSWFRLRNHQQIYLNSHSYKWYRNRNNLYDSRMLVLFIWWSHIHNNHISVRYILKCRRYYFLINKVYYWYFSILASYLILFRMHDSLFLFTINFYYLLGKPISIHCMLIHLNNTSYINIHL